MTAQPVEVGVLLGRAKCRALAHPGLEEQSNEPVVRRRGPLLKGVDVVTVKRDPNVTHEAGTGGPERS
ncbi:MAG: hypothetical protein ACYCST_14625 [Acidimicrobiales bacterium]